MTAGVSGVSSLIFYKQNNICISHQYTTPVPLPVDSVQHMEPLETNNTNM